MAILQDVEGVGVGVKAGVNLKLDLGQVKNTLNTLASALAQTGGTVTGQLTDAVRRVQELGVENLKQWAAEGGQEAKELYQQIVSKLQEAAHRGEQMARNLLASMGEKVEAAGEGMQETAAS